MRHEYLSSLSISSSEDINIVNSTIGGVFVAGDFKVIDRAR